MANKLVVLSAGAIGTPVIMRSSGFHLLNENIGNYLRAHPGIPIDAILPGTDWNTDRGYQWNAYHYPINLNTGELSDAIIHVSAGFPANTPWVASAVGTFGYPYKNLMRQFRQRAGAFIFQTKPAIYGRVSGDIDNPVIYYPIADTTGNLEPKTLGDLVASVNQVAAVYKSIGAYTTYPKTDDPDFIVTKTLSQFVTSSGALHPQGTCRAGASEANSVVDTNCMSWDIQNLMCCDASAIPNHISANPNATIMALSGRAADFVITNVLGKTIKPSALPNRGAGHFI
jgi:choline dehydrogenase-like flavoprotein